MREKKTYEDRHPRTNVTDGVREVIERSIDFVVVVDLKSKIDEIRKISESISTREEEFFVMRLRSSITLPSLYI